MSAVTFPRMTGAEYLAWERDSNEKHQLLRGEVFAMAGGSPRHNHLAARLASLLDRAFEGGPCAALSSDQKIFVPATGDYVYADVTVACEAVELAAKSADVMTNPTMIVEVLSKSTEALDRFDKWEGYRTIPTLTDYIMVSQRARHIEHYVRDAAGKWSLTIHEIGAILTLSTGATIEVDRVYERAFDFPGDERVPA